ncbi:MAG: DoxX family membrane protein [Acidobacteria bacterium]|nr:DoxX family membrane protein [Acidobacteriota bacterium]
MIGGEGSRGGRITAIEARVTLALMRLTMGALFVWVFFENLEKGLYSPGGYSGLIQYYIQRSSAPGFWKAIMASAAAHAPVAARLQGVAEISFGVLLVLGLFSRPVALAACGFLASLWVSEWGTAWIWELLTPMAVCLALALGPSGNTWALDTWLKRRFPRYPFA